MCHMMDHGSTQIHHFEIGDHDVREGKYVKPCRYCEYCNEGLGVHSSNGLVTTFNGNDVDGTITETRILQFLSYSGNKDNLKTQTICFWQKFPD
ncbi:hypothetical protein Peur_070519 [Populus x canadensis]